MTRTKDEIRQAIGAVDKDNIVLTSPNADVEIIELLEKIEQHLRPRV